METLKKIIEEKGRVVGTEVLKVDSFLNHQVDPNLMNEIGKEFAEIFKDAGVTKIVTIESSGIAPAVFAGIHMNVPVVFAKKTESRNLDADTYQSSVFSFTRGMDYIIRVSRCYLDSSDTVLFIDDFLARGSALVGLLDIANQAKAKIAGAGIVIEKGFQEGGGILRKKGLRVESLAIIESMSEEEKKIFFA